MAARKCNQMQVVAQTSQAAVGRGKYFRECGRGRGRGRIPYLGPSPYPDVPPTVFTIPGILKLLNDINPKKANGPDLIPCRILKEAATEVAPFLQFRFTPSIESGRVPSDWLKANITPVFKKGSKHLAVNYRPISLTAVPCKILEHIIPLQFMFYLVFRKELF